MENNIETKSVQEFIEGNMTDYSINTIIDMSIPAIEDGLLPIHRRILYMMYRANLLSSKNFVQSPLAVGEVVKIHHHSNDSVYGSLALLTDRNNRLHNGYILGDGNFGKFYSEKEPSAQRYTSVKLSKFAEETLLKDMDEAVIEYTNEEGGIPQPVTLSSVVPNILLKMNKAIAVGFACNTPSYNLREVCNLTKAFMDNYNINVEDYLLAPDFTSGCSLIYNKQELNNIYNTGSGSVLLRSKYRYDEENNIIEVYEIPMSTTQEKIVREVTEKMDTIKEILDVRIESGFNPATKTEELQIGIDIKKNANPDVVMNKLFRCTTLQTSFGVNMTVLKDYRPLQLGIKDILSYWLTKRIETVRKSVAKDLREKEQKLHILEGLEKVLLDIDKAISLIRNTANEDKIDENLMLEFGIDKQQASFVSSMKLRNINRNYILKQLQSIEDLRNEVEDLKDIISKDSRIKDIIKEQLQYVSDKYGQDRKTEIIYKDELGKKINDKNLMIESYNCNVIITKEGYIKKTQKGSENTKLKEGDVIMFDLSLNNKDVIYCITNKARRVKLIINDLDLKKPADLGTYLSDLEKDEEILEVFKESDTGYIINVYDNGKISKIPVDSYKGQKRIMTSCYNTNSELLLLKYVEKDCNVFLITKNGKALIVNTNEINPKESKGSQGNVAIKIKSDDELTGALVVVDNSNIELESTKGVMHIKLNEDYDSKRTNLEYYTGSCGNVGKLVYKNKNTKTIGVKAV